LNFGGGDDKIGLVLANEIPGVRPELEVHPVDEARRSDEAEPGRSTETEA